MFSASTVTRILRLSLAPGRHPSHIAGMDIRRALILAGAVLIAIGVLWPWLRALNLGRLPGDILVNRPGLQIYFPIATCVVISVLFTLLFWIFRK